MAGLGTGAAPFRAFLQHLAWLAQKGEEIGPVYYYFGSRYQGAEILYAEETEAFFPDPVIPPAPRVACPEGRRGRACLLLLRLSISRCRVSLWRGNRGLCPRWCHYTSWSRILP